MVIILHNCRSRCCWSAKCVYTCCACYSSFSGFAAWPPLAFPGFGVAPSKRKWLYTCIACRYCFTGIASKPGTDFFSKAVHVYTACHFAQWVPLCPACQVWSKRFSVSPAVKICRLFALCGSFVGCPLWFPLEREKAPVGLPVGLYSVSIFKAKKKKPRKASSVFYIGLFALPEVKPPSCAGSTSAK